MFGVLIDTLKIIRNLTRRTRNRSCAFAFVLRSSTIIDIDAARVGNLFLIVLKHKVQILCLII